MLYKYIVYMSIILDLVLILISFIRGFGVLVNDKEVKSSEFNGNLIIKINKIKSI